MYLTSGITFRNLRVHFITRHMYQNNTYISLGIMSGTSLDGVDLALCEFIRDEKSWHYHFIRTQSVEYPQELLDRLKSAYTSSAKDLALLDADLGGFYGDIAFRFIQEQKQKVNLIASHGHTVFHNPQEGYTTQIGSGAHIAAKTGVLTISDFRSLDVARRGQGAPLVPIGDSLLFPEYDTCLNLGGFANMSFDNKGIRIAYDICPVNFVLNKLAARLGLPYDDKGQIAKSGKPADQLLSKLNSLAFYHQKPPKSLGQEWVDQNIWPLFADKIKVEDLLRTYVEHVSDQIARNLNDFPGKKCLVTGGGAYNTFITELLRQKSTCLIEVPDAQLIEMKEALIFAFLGVLRIREEANSLSSVTGAIEDSVNGAIYFP